MTYAVFGQPIAHSLSPRIHRAFAAQRQQSLEYQAIELSMKRCPQGIAEFFAAGGQGANVTLPHKQSVYQWLLAEGAELSPTAVRAKAVNTLYKTDFGFGGDNTDGFGLLRHLHEYLQWPLTGDLLVIGAGGACRGILAAFSQDNTLCFNKIYVTNRTAATAEALALEFADVLPVMPLPWEYFQGVHATFSEAALPVFNGILHTTSLGHTSAFPLTMEKSFLTAGTWAYDLSYGAAAASFLVWASAAGIEKVSDGLGMLVYQAAAAFARWHGWWPQASLVLQALAEERKCAI